MSIQRCPITVAYGDGIGPEIMEATLHVMKAAGALIDTNVVEIGEKVYLKGHLGGIEAKSWDSIRQTKAFLKAPITTPQGGGFRSLNVTIRGAMGLYANVRPCVSYYPYIATKHPVMDVVIIRENEEDLYTGIEYRQTNDVCQSLKIISRSGCEKIVRYAFEYAKANGRKKVTCFTKDNIMKMADGLFHKVFDEIAVQYPDIINEHWIIDIGAAKLADTPEAFDVIVMANLYGDILSDVAAQIAGSVGLAGSANIGDKSAMFEAIHGSAPRRAGQNMANPSGLMLAGVQMLAHIGQFEEATRMHNAWLKTIEEGIHTYDIFKDGISRQKVGTKEFAEAVGKRMGQMPEKLRPAKYNKMAHMDHAKLGTPNTDARRLVGVDVYLSSHKPMGSSAEMLKKCSQGHFELEMITNRGVKVWPESFPETSCIDQWRCRFMLPENNKENAQAQIIRLLGALDKEGFDFIKTENLYTYAGEAGFSSGKAKAK